jgi:hypothetical protein
MASDYTDYLVSSNFSYYKISLFDMLQLQDDLAEMLK